MDSTDKDVNVHNVNIPADLINADLAEYGLSSFLQGKVLDFVYDLIRNKFGGDAVVTVHDYGEPQSSSDIFNVIDLSFCSVTIHEMPAWDPLGNLGKFLPFYAPRPRINIRIVKK